MARYYVTLRLNDGSWTEVDTGRPGSPTYRDAKADADLLRASAEQLGAPIRAARILLDLSSIDLTKRDDVMAMLAYDPVMKTLFEYARQGGVSIDTSPAQLLAQLQQLEQLKRVQADPPRVIETVPLPELEA